MALGLIPLFCLGVILLTGVVIIFALRRGTRSINEKLNDQPASNAEANNRWARGDLKNASHSRTKEIKMTPCPACGGENKNSSTTCAYCGNKIQ